MIYRAAAGKPGRGFAHNLKGLTSYQVDPGEAAYYTIRDLGSKYLDRKSVERPSMSPTKRQNALYYYKQALKYGDKQAAERYLKKYMDMDGSTKGVAASIRSAEPLGFMPRAHRSKFTDGLNAEESRILNAAILWYRKTYKP